LRDELRGRGYLVRALEVARACVELGGATPDVQAAGFIEGEIAVLSGELIPTVREPERDYEPAAGRILHVLGPSLPGLRSEETLWTHGVALAQREAGLDPYVVTEMGFGNDGEEYTQEDVDGVSYHRIPGAPARDLRLDNWMRAHVQRVANVVRVVRPAVSARRAGLRQRVDGRGDRSGVRHSGRVRAAGSRGGQLAVAAGAGVRVVGPGPAPRAAWSARRVRVATAAGGTGADARPSTW
jgi:hypothetical protein